MRSLTRNDKLISYGRSRCVGINTLGETYIAHTVRLLISRDLCSVYRSNWTCARKPIEVIPKLRSVGVCASSKSRVYVGHAESSQCTVSRLTRDGSQVGSVIEVARTQGETVATLVRYFERFSLERIVLLRGTFIRPFSIEITHALPREGDPT